MTDIPINKYLGTICRRGHEYKNTGKSLRHKSSAYCVECAKENLKKHTTKHYKRDVEHDDSKNADRNRTPIDVLSIKLDIPLELTKLLVGGTEKETKHNVIMFLDCIYDYGKHRVQYEERLLELKLSLARRTNGYRGRPRKESGDNVGG